jgi:hypothetical protein
MDHGDSRGLGERESYRLQLYNTPQTESAGSGADEPLQYFDDYRPTVRASRYPKLESRENSVQLLGSALHKIENPKANPDLPSAKFESSLGPAA